ncbi:MAG: beta-glucuronidase [Candidatus Hydrogenedentes bacterium]|nr:beta-glucuronidase [Candidatus Hydrogenedentota bacterium]
MAVVAAVSAADIPRPEYPKPQFQRDLWINLNGTWDFAFDFDKKGLDEHWQTMPDKFDKKIVVPFCVESKLSGIGYTDFIETVWYRRVFTLPENWSGKRVFLNFGAVDYESRVWVNGTEVGRHYGGATSFSFDITDAVKKGRNEIVLYVFDDVRKGGQPSGKQSLSRESRGVMYTRTTGIWQTVWLEARPQSYIQSVHIVPDLDGSRFVLTPTFVNVGRKYDFRATLLSAAGTPLADVTASAVNGIPVSLRVARPRAWSPQDPYLYGLRFELIKGNRVIDTVKSYGGLRKFHIEGNRIYLNNRPIFLRFVLDQGFYPDGIWTAPTDAALKHDIELSQAAGFNGARLHQKVFEERFHYWADRLGYLTWAEFCDWGNTHSFDNPQGVLNLEREWRDAVLRDRNYPSILAWTPLNETSGAAKDHYVPYSRSVRSLYAMTHALDPTRPLNTTSGYVHVITDIFTVHDYDQNPETFRKRYAGVTPRGGPGVYVCNPELSVPYEGQPYVVDEYGGTFWTKEYTGHPEKAGKSRSKWGYGKTAVQVEDRIKELTDILLNQPNISGFTYTQLTDVEQEVNGIYTYDRKPKFDIKRMKTIFGAPAAIEQR